MRRNLNVGSVKFVLGPDEITGDEDPDVYRVEMSCGHAVDPNSLTEWCRSLANQGHFKFYCPAIIDGTNEKCNKEWSYLEVRRHALLSVEEQQFFEEKLATLAAKMYCEYKQTLRAKELTQKLPQPRGGNMPKVFQVFVIGLQGQRIAIDVATSECDFKMTTIVTLKKKVIETQRSGFENTDDLRLIFADQELEDNKRLFDYSIKDKSTILVILGLNGGRIQSGEI